jgi:hypothetical protein
MMRVQRIEPPQKKPIEIICYEVIAVGFTALILTILIKL